MAGKRPNILLVMVDQLSALATRPYGNDDVLTPNLNRLADQGTLFENAYCNSPLCGPSRASFMTGVLPNRLPVYDNAQELPASVPTFAHHLRRGGYKTVLSGKMHFVGPDQLHGFEERLTTDVYPADFYWTWSWERLREEVKRAESNPPKAIPAFNRHPSLSPVPYSLDFNHDETSMAETVLTAGITPWSMYFAYDEETHFRALERLRELAVDPAQPWLLCVSYIQPHQPFLTTEEYWERYEDRQLRLPEPVPASHKLHPADLWPNVWHGVNKIEPSEDDLSRARRAYYANTSYVDDKLGDLVGVLLRLGIADDTIIIFCSDHGEMLGEQGMWFKRTCREWSARVPLVIAGPGVARGTVTAGVSLVDLYPTLVTLTGMKLPDGYESFAPRLDGRDLTAALSGGTVEGPDEIIMEYSGDGVCQPICAIVADRIKLVQVHSERGQLFDLRSDPTETRNVIDDPSYGELASSLGGRIRAGWDGEALARDVVESQRLRVFLNEALYRGTYRAWDFEPARQAAGQFVRPVLTQPYEHIVYERILMEYRRQKGLHRDPSSIWPDDADGPGPES